MAGRGPAPKPSGRRVRRNADAGDQTVLPADFAEQPELPELPGGEEWCPATIEWWRHWRESPLSTLFGRMDWEFLKDTALLHQDVWAYQNFDRLPELRLRVSKFGVTLEDRARLRIQFADADEKDAARGANAPRSARERRDGLKVVPLEKPRKNVM